MATHSSILAVNEKYEKTKRYDTRIRAPQMEGVQYATEHLGRAEGNY